MGKKWQKKLLKKLKDKKQIKVTNKTNKPKWVIFDVGGVLVDWHGGLKAVEKYLGCNHTMVLKKLLRFLDAAELGKLPMLEVWKKVIEELKINKSPQIAVQNWIEGVSLVDSTWSLVNSLNRVGYHLVIFSNNWYSVEAVLMNKSPTLFERYIESWKEGFKKPDKAFYLTVEEKISCSGNDIFFIDDKQINIETAKEIEWQTFLFDLGEDKGKTSCNQLREILL